MRDITGKFHFLRLRQSWSSLLSQILHDLGTSQLHFWIELMWFIKENGVRIHWKGTSDGHVVLTTWELFGSQHLVWQLLHACAVTGFLCVFFSASVRSRFGWVVWGDDCVFKNVEIFKEVKVGNPSLTFHGIAWGPPFSRTFCRW